MFLPPEGSQYHASSMAQVAGQFIRPMASTVTKQLGEANQTQPLLGDTDRVDLLRLADTGALDDEVLDFVVFS